MATGSFCASLLLLCVLNLPQLLIWDGFEKKKRVIPKTVLRLRMSMRN